MTKTVVIKNKLTEKEKAAIKDYIKNIYTNTDSPVAFTSPQKIYKYVKDNGDYQNLTLKRIKEILSEIDSYTVFRQKVHLYKHPRVRVQGYMQQIDVDLMDVRNSKADNDGVTFIFVAIDILSKLAYVKPITSKSSLDIIKATKDLLKKWPKIQSISSDRGSEFKSSAFQSLLKENNIIHFFVGGSLKATIVERFIKTLRSKISKYKREKNTDRYIDVLKHLVHGYNSTEHSSTKMIPKEVNEFNSFIAYDNLYVNKNSQKPSLKKKFKLDVGDTVRIGSEKTLFKRESYQRFSDELFTITERYKKDDVSLYKIKDCAGEDIIGSYFDEELVKVGGVENAVYRIESILDEKKIKGVKHVLVKFVGYDRKCALWVKKSDVISLYNDN